MWKLRLLVGLVGASCLGRSAEANLLSNPPDVKCGAYCLFVGLKALGLFEGPYSVFEKTLDPPGPSGYSMEQLERFAQAHGARTLAVEADLESLARLSVPNACIAFADNHFLIVKRVDLELKSVTLIDPPDEYDSTLIEFRKRFSQRSLILGPPDSPPGFIRSTPWGMILSLISACIAAIVGLRILYSYRSARPAGILLALGSSAIVGCDSRTIAEPKLSIEHRPNSLVVEPAEHHVGKVFAIRPDQTITLENVLKNPTGSVIKLREIQKSCTCTSVEIESTTIPAGGSSVLKSTFRLGHLPGPKRVEVLLNTDGAEAEPSRIVIDWDVVTPLFTEKNICQFSRIDSQGSAEQQVTLMNRGLSICSGCQIAVEPNHGLIEASARLESASDLPVHSVEKDTPGTPSRLGALSIRILPGGESGDYHQAVSVLLRCRGSQRAKLDLPVEWSVRPELEATPARLWLGVHTSSATLSKKLRILSHDGCRLVNPRVTCDPSKSLVAYKTTPASDGSVELEIDLTLTGEPGIGRGSLSIVFDDPAPRPVVVPFSFIIQSSPATRNAEPESIK